MLVLVSFNPSMNYPEMSIIGIYEKSHHCELQMDKIAGNIKKHKTGKYKFVLDNKNKRMLYKQDKDKKTNSFYQCMQSTMGKFMEKYENR